VPSDLCHAGILWDTCPPHRAGQVALGGWLWVTCLGDRAGDGEGAAAHRGAGELPAHAVGDFSWLVGWEFGPTSSWMTDVLMGGGEGRAGA